MLGIKGEIAFRREAGKARSRPWFDRQDIVAGVSVRIEQDVPDADSGERIALLRKLQRDVGLRRDDVDGSDGIAGFERQGLAGEARRHRLRPADRDFVQPVAVARYGRDDDPQLPGLLRYLLGRDRAGAIIIAFGTKQPDEKLFVFAHARRDLSAVRRFAVAILERRQVPESALQTDLLKTFDLQSVTDGGRLFLRLRGRLRRRDVERRQRRQRFGERRIVGHRGVGHGLCTGGRRRGHRKALDRLQWIAEGGIQRRQRSLELVIGYDRGVGILRQLRRRLRRLASGSAGPGQCADRHRGLQDH